MRSLIIAISFFLSIGFLMTNCKKEKPEPPVIEDPQDTIPTPVDTTTIDTLGTGYDEESIGEITETPEVVVVYIGALPAQVSLSMPPAKNQGGQGSCTAWAVTYYLMGYLKHQAEGTSYYSGGNPDNSVLCSPAYTFNQVKLADPDNDCSGSGAIQHLTKLKSQGVCTLAEMPYNASDCSTQPNSAQITAASNNKISQYFRISRDNIPLLKTLIALEQPLVFAISADGPLHHLEAPYIWTPGTSGSGHSVTLCGYSDTYNGFQIINSWGPNWGDNGKFYITYSDFQALPNGKQCYTAFWKSNPLLNDLTNGLESHYLLDGNMNDELGIDGTGSGVTATTDRNGISSSALMFNGSTAYTENSYNLNNTEFSIACWIRPEVSSSSEQVIFSQVSQNTDANLGIELMLDNDTIKLDMPIGTGRVKLGGSQKITAGNWYHIAVTFNEKFVRLYVNGTPVEIGVCTQLFDASSTGFNLGCRYANSAGLKSNFYNGKLDDFRFYSRAINDAEVDELFAN